MTAHDDIQTIRTVGFIGLGSMGLPMALNLLKAGFVVRGHSRSAERTRLFTEAGGIDAPDPGSILEKADAIITMVGLRNGDRGCPTATSSKSSWRRLTGSRPEHRAAASCST